MLPVDLIDPDRVKVLEEQKVAQVWLLFRLLCLVDVAPQHCLLESVLHNEVLRYFLEEISEVSLLLNIILEEYVVILVERRSHAYLVLKECQLTTVSLTD